MTRKILIQLVEIYKKNSIVGVTVEIELTGFFFLFGAVCSWEMKNQCKKGNQPNLIDIHMHVKFSMSNKEVNIYTLLL